MDSHEEDMTTVPANSLTPHLQSVSAHALTHRHTHKNKLTNILFPFPLPHCQNMLFLFLCPISDSFQDPRRAPLLPPAPSSPRSILPARPCAEVIAGPAFSPHLSALPGKHEYCSGSPAPSCLRPLCFSSTPSSLLFLSLH